MKRIFTNYKLRTGVRLDPLFVLDDFEDSGQGRQLGLCLNARCLLSQKLIL